MRIGDTEFTPWQNFYLIMGIAVSTVSLIVYFKTKQIPARETRKIKSVLTPPKIKVTKTYTMDELIQKASSSGSSEEISLDGSSSPSESISLGGDENKSTPRRASRKPSGKININKAGLGELMTIPDMTLKTARSIIDYRKKMGDIWEFDELKGLPGVNPSFINTLKRKAVLE